MKVEDIDFDNDKHIVFKTDKKDIKLTKAQAIYIKCLSLFGNPCNHMRIRKSHLVVNDILKREGDEYKLTDLGKEIASLINIKEVG